MVNKTKILSELSKIAVDAMGTISGLKKEIEVIVKIRVEKIINKMNLVKRDEFESLKKIVQSLIIENKKLKSKTTSKSRSKNIKNSKKKRKNS